MPHTTRVVLPALVVTIAIASWFVPARAQTRGDDLVPALLTEVKGLRAAMEQMASVSARSQLLVGRLQLQESRITAMSRRLDTVRDALAPARRELEKVQDTLTSLQTPATGKEEGLAGLVKQLGLVKIEDVQREVAARQETVNRLAAEEQQLLQQIGADQARWTEINQRLDELERALAKR
jgi:chromosome segregation ATPase